MSNPAHKALSLLKLVLGSDRANEKNTARAQAAMICAKHALDYDALLAQASEESCRENPETSARTQNIPQGGTWDETPVTVWTTTTKYDPASRASRKLLAEALVSVLQGVGFSHVSGGDAADDEVWEKVVGSSENGEVVVHVGTSICEGLAGVKGGSTIRMWGTVGGRLIVDHKTRNGRKGHTVRRCGEFGQWQDGADHAHKNNPGILGRVYRELINVQDATLDLAGTNRAKAPTAEMQEDSGEFLKRTMRRFSAELRVIPHPTRYMASQGMTMYDYVGWCLENRYDRQGRCRWDNAREVIESKLG